MAILALVRRDLARYRRNPLRTALLFALPLVMAGIFALVFGGGGPEELSIRVLLWDEDDSLLTMLADGAVGRSDEANRIDIVSVGSEGLEMMEDGDASALIHIPEGFTDAYLVGEATTIDVVKNPSQWFLPKIVDEGVHLGGGILSVGSRVFRSELEQIAVMRGADGFPSDMVVAGLSAGMNSRLKQLDGVLIPPLITLETNPTTEPEETEEVGSSTSDILAMFLPGFAVMGVLFIAQNATRDILRDRESGLLRHLLTAPVTPAQILIAKCLSVILVCAVGFLLLVGISAIAGLDWGSPVAIAAIAIATAVAASGTLLLIMSLVGSERQGDALTTIVIIVWSMLGGIFMPLSQMPSFIRPISASTLTYWATDACNIIVLNGGGLTDIRLNLAVLLGTGTAFLIAGALVLGLRIRRGAV